MTGTAIKCCARGDGCVHPDGPCLPATTEYFSPQERGKYGVTSRCRACCAAANRERLRIKRLDPAFLEKEAEAARERRQNPEYRERERERNRARNQTAERKAYNRALQQRPESKVQNRERWRKYRQKPEVQERQRRYRQRPEYKEWNRNYMRERRQDPFFLAISRTRTSEYQRRPEAKARARALSLEKYRTKEGKARIIAKLHRREARKRRLPDTLTAAQWRAALDHFKERCAYCNNTPPDSNPLCVEHFVPLVSADCPGTVSFNVIPACKSCNSSKADKDARNWLTARFGEEHALEILEHIHAYFSSITGRQ